MPQEHSELEPKEDPFIEEARNAAQKLLVLMDSTHSDLSIRGITTVDQEHVERFFDPHRKSTVAMPFWIEDFVGRIKIHLNIKRFHKRKSKLEFLKRVKDFFSQAVLQFERRIEQMQGEGQKRNVKDLRDRDMRKVLEAERQERKRVLIQIVFKTLDQMSRKIAKRRKE